MLKAMMLDRTVPNPERARQPSERRIQLQANEEANRQREQSNQQLEELVASNVERMQSDAMLETARQITTRSTKGKK